MLVLVPICAETDLMGVIQGSCGRHLSVTNVVGEKVGRAHRVHRDSRMRLP